MRPHQHWHLRRRRRPDRLLWGGLLSVGVVVVAALLVWQFATGHGAPEVERESVVAPGESESVVPNDGESVVAPSTCVPGAECAPAPATPECVGVGDCAPANEGAPSAPDAPLPGNEFVVASKAPPPRVSAQGAAVIEQGCGALLYGHNAHKQLRPASLTKIVTALVAVEQAQPTDVVDVRVNSALLRASTRSSVMGLEPGQRLPLRDLLYGLLLPSGNDAAIAIAEHVGGTVPAFVSLMNGKVQELGLRNTRFANPHGLDERGLYTSAYDIAVLGRELLAHPELAKIVATKTYQPSWDGAPVWNGNKLLYEYPGAVGVKTGLTVQAGQTLVAAAKRDGRTIVVSVLSSGDRYTDATALLNWAFANTTSPCFA